MNQEHACYCNVGGKNWTSVHANHDDTVLLFVYSVLLNRFLLAYAPPTLRRVNQEYNVSMKLLSTYLHKHILNHIKH